MFKPSESALQEHLREGAEAKAITKNFSRDTVTPPTTDDTAVVVQQMKNRIDRLNTALWSRREISRKTKRPAFYFTLYGNRRKTESFKQIFKQYA